jgi:hypothetical protein
MADVIPLDAERRKRTSYRLVGFRSVRRAGYFCVEPDLLTAYEFASLRAQAKERSSYSRDAFAQLR